MIAGLLADPALAPVLAALPHARIVGGAVRDALAGVPIADIDLATPDPPEATTASLERAGLRVIPTGLSHGTVTALVDDRAFEITTLRRDVSTDGRHAEVAWTTDWRADAARRDFTINAMSLARDGTLYDYFGGQSDLAAGIVRFVGDPATRIAEDFLRILRFFRFFARYARAAPDQAATSAIRAAVPGLARLSPERLWSELKKILSAPAPGAAIHLMADLGVLSALIPEGADPARLDRLLATPAPPTRCSASPPSSPATCPPWPPACCFPTPSSPTSPPCAPAPSPRPPPPTPTSAACWPTRTPHPSSPAPF